LAWNLSLFDLDRLTDHLVMEGLRALLLLLVNLLPLHGAVVELGSSLLLHHHTCS
jgi:hypothetical protein